MALGSRGELKGIEATKQVLVDRARERAAEWEGIRLKNYTAHKAPERGAGRALPTAPDLGEARRAAAMGSVFGALGKLADGFSLDALSPKEKYEAAKRDHKNAREADQNADYAALSRRAFRKPVAAARGCAATGTTAGARTGPMMAWRPAPIRQEEPQRDKDERDPKTESPPVTAAVIAEPPGLANAKPRSFAGTIKQLFKDAR